MTTWFSDLVEDDDVLGRTNIDIEELAKLIGHTGAAITNLLTMLYGHKELEREVVDIGILRFPDIENPYFRVRLTLCIEVLWSLD